MILWGLNTDKLYFHRENERERTQQPGAGSAPFWLISFTTLWAWTKQERSARANLTAAFNAMLSIPLTRWDPGWTGLTSKALCFWNQPYPGYWTCRLAPIPTSPPPPPPPRAHVEKFQTAKPHVARTECGSQPRFSFKLRTKPRPTVPLRQGWTNLSSWATAERGWAEELTAGSWQG